MSESTTITCDGCGEDITYTGNSVDWRLALVNEPIPLRGSIATDMMIFPRIEHDVHFCGLPCLQEWLWRQAFHRESAWNYHRWKEFAP